MRNSSASSLEKKVPSVSEGKSDQLVGELAVLVEGREALRARRRERKHIKQ